MESTLVTILGSILAGSLAVASPDLVQNPASPAKGVLLVADTGMPDLRFRETVILLLDHSDEGSVGLVINRPTEVTVQDLLPKLKREAASAHHVYLGGPVEIERLIYLVRHNETLEMTDPVFGNIQAGGRIDQLADLMNSKSDTELRVFVGYAGWGPGQLERELYAGGWLLRRASPESVFSRQPESLWKRLVRPPGLLVEGPKTALPHLVIPGISI